MNIMCTYVLVVYVCSCIMVAQFDNGNSCVSHTHVQLTCKFFVCYTGQQQGCHVLLVEPTPKSQKKVQ